MRFTNCSHGNVRCARYAGRVAHSAVAGGATPWHATPGPDPASVASPERHPPSRTYYARNQCHTDAAKAPKVPATDASVNSTQYPPLTRADASMSNFTSSRSSAICLSCASKRASILPTLNEMSISFTACECYRISLRLNLSAHRQRRFSIDSLPRPPSRCGRMR